MSKITVHEAKEGLESIGMWMDSRYNSRFVGTPIQTWEMPRKEKGFFTIYAMNLVLESDGFESLATQKQEDVKAFIDLLGRLGAKKTSAFVRTTLVALKSRKPSGDYKCTSEYYKLFEREKVWLKLLEYIGRGIYVSYVLRAQAIMDAGGNTFNPKEWYGDLPKA